MSSSNGTLAPAAARKVDADAEEVAEILRGAVKVENVLLPHHLGFVTIPTVTPNEAPEGMAAEDATAFRNHSTTYKTVKFVSYMAKKKGFKGKFNASDEKSTPEEKEAMRQLAILISRYLPLEDGANRNATSWGYVLDLLSTPRRDMEKLINRMPASAARDDALKALKLPKPVVRKVSENKVGKLAENKVGKVTEKKTRKVIEKKPRKVTEKKTRKVSEKKVGKLAEKVLKPSEKE